MADDPKPAPAGPAALPPTAKDVERYLAAVAEFREVTTRELADMRKKLEELVAQGKPLPPAPSPAPAPKDDLLEGWDE